MRPRARRRHWFLPQAPDLIGLLVNQGAVTIRGMEALERWAAGESEAGEAVRAAEHEADDARRTALSALRQAFVTPVGPEDLFELSERLDRVMNHAKDLVREAEVLAMAPDEAMSDMSHLSCTGVRRLVEAFPNLALNPEEATRAADDAIHQQRGIERVYRRAMSQLLETNDPRQMAGRRELYRRCARIGDAIEHVADRIWYAIVKES